MGRKLFVTKKTREDIFNPIEEKPGWIYYLTTTLQFLYLITFVFGMTLLLITAYVEHTHFRPGQLNNNLYSERYNSLWWLALFFAAMRFIFFLCMQSMFLYRNTTCCGGKNGGCTVFWMIILFSLLALDCIALFFNSHYLHTCNGVEAVGNPCNSYKWCCLADVHSKPGNSCPNTLTCPGTIVLEKNGLFLAIFAFNVVFVALESYFVGLPLMLWFFDSGPENWKQQQLEQENQQQEQEENEESKRTAEMALMSADIIDVPRATMVAAETKMRRPLAPRTPLLAAAATGPMVHVTPPTTVLEKNTKQP